MRRVVSALGGAAATVALLMGGASAASADAQVPGPCGFYSVGWSAYYNHCGSGSVVIRVEVLDGAHSYEQCVPPGVTRLGGAMVDWAEYAGRSC